MEESTERVGDIALQTENKIKQLRAEIVDFETLDTVKMNKILKQIKH